MTASLDLVDQALDGWLPGAAQPLILGLCGAQGSGKSTLAAGLKSRLEGRGLAVALLSLDDLYWPRETRAKLARTIHPLLATRGVPGTHDTKLGERVLGDLKAGRDTLLPRFDKAADSPLPAAAWEPVNGPTDVVIFEGWCVGAAPQDEAALSAPVNALEAEHDPEGVWRRHVNDALRGDYARLFCAIDRLVLLAAPGFDVVQAWRAQQERDLRLRLQAEGRVGAHVMSDDALARFIQHYERLTRHILAKMPGRADLVIPLDERRQVTTRP